MMKIAERSKVWLVLLLMFALGAIAGTALDRAYLIHHWPSERSASGSSGGGGDGRSSRGRHGSERFLEMMRSELNLSEEQVAAISRIIDETRAEYQKLQAEVRPQYDAVRRRERELIQALLTPEQQQRFAEMIKRRQQRHGKHDRDK